MRPGTHIFVVILFIPIVSIFLYINFIKCLSFSKRLITLVSFFLFTANYLSMVYLSYLLPENLTILESFFYSAILYLGFFVGTYPWLEHSFKKAYNSNKKSNPNMYKDCSNVAEYFPNSKKAMLVAYAHKFSIYGFGCSMLVIFICRRMYGIDMNHKTYGWIYYAMTIFPASCLVCMAFLRLLVKCPNCECSLFPVTQELDAFFTIPKRVIKDKAIDCLVCSATYALDKRLDLDELRRDKKKRIEEGRFVSIGPDGRKRI